jgi:membrane associated rhomboid family serine protease
MIPLRDENPSRTFPIVTVLIIGINVLVFLWEIGQPEGVQARYMMVPAEIIHGVDLPPFYSFHPLYATIFTSMFMHGGLMHIAGNMLYLWIFGDNVEDMLGPVKFVVFYLACGVAAAGAQILSSPNSTVPTLGASGAIAGVLGAYLITHGGARVFSIVTLGFFWTTAWIPAWLVLGLWFVLQIFSQTALLASPQTGGVAYMAHIGGFVAGAFLIRLLGGRSDQRAPSAYDDWSRRGPSGGGYRPWS